jgi:hypothetical protein
MNLDKRKQAVLDQLGRFGAAWLGDVPHTASEMGTVRLAFRALTDDGKIIPERLSRNGRVYDRLAQPNQPQQSKVATGAI